MLSFILKFSLNDCQTKSFEKLNTLLSAIFKLFNFIYYLILTPTLTPQLSPNPNCKPHIKCEQMNIVQCSFSLCKIIFLLVK